MRIIKKISKDLGKKYNINFNIIDFEEWHNGLNIELEHGSKFGTLTNITNNNVDLTAKIAIAHLIEDPYYYKRLIKMEKEIDIYWKNKIKPNIFNS